MERRDIVLKNTVMMYLIHLQLPVSLEKGQRVMCILSNMKMAECFILEMETARTVLTVQWEMIFYMVETAAIALMAVQEMMYYGEEEGTTY